LLSLAESSFDGVVVVVPGSWCIAYANPVMAELLGRSVDDLIGVPIADLFEVSRPATWQQSLERAALGNHEDVPFEARLRRTGAASLSVGLRLCRLVVDAATLIGIITRTEVTAPDASGRPSLAQRDPLTGLADRTFIMSRIESLLAGDRAEDRRFAVLFIDLDNFKQVNDSYGHLAGDRVLSEVAQRLAHALRAGDHIARFGGDEFVVLVEHVAEWDEIGPVVDRIRAALAEPIAVPDGMTTLGASIGVAEASHEFQTPEELLAAADRAMYASKRVSS
jgi:diguanylate cyclase (GGDEF)-like protein